MAEDFEQLIRTQSNSSQQSSTLAAITAAATGKNSLHKKENKSRITTGTQPSECGTNARKEESAVLKLLSKEPKDGRLEAR